MNQGVVQETRVSPLIHTKVRIPRLSNLLSRSRLLDLLHENIHRKLLLISAGPGYGKTSLLVDFTRSTDLTVCWYTLDSSDGDPRVFLDYLLEAIRVHYPSFGEKTRALLRQGRGSAGDLHAIIGVLVNELVEEIPEYVIIALDDYHTVDEGGTINQVLKLLLQYLPENVHIIVSGRTVPPLSVIRLAAYGEMAAIGNEHLCYTHAEVRALLKQNFDLDLTEEESQHLATEGEGWITGILLLAQTIRQGSMEVLTRARAPQDHLYAYLTDQVLRQLPPEVRSSITKMSILSQMSAGICDALLERQDSAQILAFLERHNLFLIPLEGGWYRLHDLFREFLLEEARVDRDTVVHLHRRAAQLWRERGEPAEAVEHLLQAQAYEEAAEEIERLAKEFFARGRFQVFLRWVEALPETVCWDRPGILLFAGKVYVAIGQGEKGRASLLRAEHLFDQRGNVQGYVQAVADRTLQERRQGAYQEVLQTARTALARVQGLVSTAVMDLHRTIGLSLHALGDLPSAEEHFHAAVECSLSDDGLYNQALAYLDLGHCLQAQGQMEETEAAFQQALERCRKIHSPVLITNTLNNLAMGPFLRGEFEEAQDLLEQALDAARTSLSPYFMALVLASLGDLYRDLGDSPAARQSYLEGLEQARQADIAALQTYLLDALGNLARQEGSFPESCQYLQNAMEVASSSPRDRMRVQVSLALLKAAEGEAIDALRLLKNATVELEQGGWYLELLRAWLAQAIVQARRRSRKESQDALRKAIALAENMGVLEPFLAEGEALLPLLGQLPPISGSDFQQKVLRRLQAWALLQGRVVSAEQLQPTLCIQAFGVGRVFWDEEEIPMSDWEYRLVRELFFFLFFRAPVRKGQVGLVFWPDLSAAQMSSVFHATLYKARRAAGYSFVVFQGDVYQWNSEVPYRCDVVDFERLLDQVEALPSDDPEAITLLEKAISLYRGDLLEEFDRDWCLLHREKLKSRYLQSLLLLGKLYLDQKTPAQARETFQQALQEDNYREEAYRGLMRSLVAAGERAAAIQVYQQCRDHLRQELQIEPSEETRTVYEAIVKGYYPATQV